jgi:hypothetical protein
MISPGESNIVAWNIPRLTGVFHIPSDEHYLLVVVQDPTL